MSSDCFPSQEEVVSVFAKLVLSNDEVCGLVIGDTCGTPYNPLGDWNITFPSTPKPPVVPPQPPKVSVTDSWKFDVVRSGCMYRWNFFPYE